jgi:uncharacterized surface protein with fasciclin (FAS1) repeats
MTTKKPARILLVALAAGILLVAAACGSDSKTSSTAATAAPSTTTKMVDTTVPAKTIVQLASGNPDLSTLVTAVTAAGLGETLSGTGPFTVFAPTNEAFAALPAGTLDNLLKPENKEQLVKILTYHVVAGEVPSSAIKAGPVKSVEGQDLTITTPNGKVMVNGATVVTADVMASNGVVHVIDAVLLPPTM